ncbi:MAG: hypothetical protein HY259_14970 [Chloroflexi bacterium]|nr:hypothetical protein [Chloroflexota bacterium]MBI3734739.1 hypothetical protein [Chloroflexota bacterium]
MTEHKEREKSTRRAKRAVPSFANREDEARYWDTHSLADHWDEAKPVRVRFARNLSQGITVRLDPETLEALRRRAHQQGIGPTTLARMWILEHLHKT